MMGLNPLNTVLVASTTITGSTTSSELNIPAGFRAAILLLNVSQASGTSPTLDVKVQDVLTPAGTAALFASPAGTKVYDDFAAFTQMTTTGSTVLRLNPSAFTAAGAVATVGLALADGTLAAGTGKVGAIGLIWRFKYVVTATTPSFTFSITAQFIP